MRYIFAIGPSYDRYISDCADLVDGAEEEQAFSTASFDGDRFVLLITAVASLRATVVLCYDFRDIGRSLFV